MDESCCPSAGASPSLKILLNDLFLSPPGYYGPQQTLQFQKISMHSTRLAVLFLVPGAVYSFLLTPKDKDISTLWRSCRGSSCPFSKSGPTLERRAAADSYQMSASNDLLIVGAGYLGRMLIKEYKSIFPGARVIAETRFVLKPSFTQNDCA